jgi:hypothetical protein
MSVLANRLIPVGGDVEIRAIQDLDCIDRAKFRYLLPAPPPTWFLDRFEDATVTIRRFSQFSPRARDLFSIRKAGAFLAEGVIGGQEIIVSFYADPEPMPAGLLDEFAKALKGMGEIVYVQDIQPHCKSCLQGVLKQCRHRRELFH